MITKIRMTKSAVANIEFSKGSALVYRDTQEPHLFLKVGKRTKTYYLVKKFRGRMTWVKLGPAEYYAPDAIRKMVTVKLGLMADNVDPRAGRASITAVPTFKRCMEDLIQARQLKESSKIAYERHLQAYLKPWSDRLVSDITEEDVMRLLGNLRRRKRPISPTTIASAFTHAKAIFNFAKTRYKTADDRRVIHKNPVSILHESKTMPTRDRKRRRVFADQLPIFLGALDELQPAQPVMCDLVRLWLLTGMRNSEARLLTRDKVDLSRGIIHLKDTKNKEDLDLPITKHMEDILRRRMEFVAFQDTESKWLFPSVAKRGIPISDTGPLQELMREKTDIVFTPHDLRRTFISAGASIGLRDVAKMCANHKLPADDITAQYMSWDATELRSLLQKVQDRLLLKPQVVAPTPI